MSKLQTYISERKKLFREKFVRDDGLMDKYIYLDTVDENGIPETVTTAEAIESFNEETIEGCMAIVREVIVKNSFDESGKGDLLAVTGRVLQDLNTKE